jgi:TctA family transporter
MIASFSGASIGILVMILFSPLIVDFALSFGPAEYFSLMALGLFAASALARGSALKSVAMVILGLLLGLVGTDITSGYQRFTFGIAELYDGIDLVALALGLFAIAETLGNLNRLGGQAAARAPATRRAHGEKGLVRLIWPSILRGSALGSFFGVLPGTGSTVASYISYAVEKRVSKTPERFGYGAIEGVSGPEASNNAAAQTAFVPTMTLGIPGDPLMALMLSAMVIQGIQPGPQMVTERPDVFWGLIASFWVGNLFLLLLNIPLVGIWIRLLSVPYRLFFPALLFFVCIGVYSSGNSLTDVAIALVIGFAGFGMLRLGFEAAPLLLGFVLGPLIEENFRRALLISRGDPMVFLESPICIAIAGVCLLLLLQGAFRRWRSAQAA